MERGNMMAKEKKYVWLKLQNDFFTKNLAIKKLRRMAGGDTFTIILLKIYLISLEHEGKIIFEGIEDTLAEEIASRIDEDIDNVSMTISFMQRYKMIEVMPENNFVLPYVIKNIGSESESAERVREYRARKKELEKSDSANSLPCNEDVTECNEGVMTSNTEREEEEEIEIEREKEEEVEEEVEDKGTSSQNSEAEELEKPVSKPINYARIVNWYNSICISYPKVRTLSEKRKKAIKSRLKVFAIEDFKTLFEKAEASDFLKGKINVNWNADFDWLIRDDNMPKVLEGKYDNKNKTSNKSVSDGNTTSQDDLDDLF